MKELDNVARFYAFWRWEYQRRNIEYRKNYERFREECYRHGQAVIDWFRGDREAAIIEDLMKENALRTSAPWEVADEYAAFISIHGRPPKDPGQPDSDDLLADLLASTPSYEKVTRRYRKTSDLYSLNYTNLQPAIRDFRPTTVREEVLEDGKTEVVFGGDYRSATIVVDLAHPIEEIAAQVKWLLYRTFVEPSPFEAQVLNFRKTLRLIDRSMLLRSLDVVCSQELKRRCVNVRPERQASRVLGLWLYDKVSLGEKLASAIARVQEQLVRQEKRWNEQGLPDKPRFEQPNSLHRFHKKTSECISSVDVLPMR